MALQSAEPLGQWDALKIPVNQEFIPHGCIRRSRKKIRALQQRTSVLLFLKEFRNIIIDIPEIREDEKLDKFCGGVMSMI